MRLSRRLFAAAAAAAAALLPAAAMAQPTPGLSLEAHALKLRAGGELAAETGTFWVPEDRRDPASRRIPIRFVRLKSTSATPGAPIVYLAGGPGGSGTGTFQGPRQPVFLALRAVADVIVLDQRGTGLSNSLEPCAGPATDWTRTVLTEASYTADYRAALARCLPVWRSQGAAIAGYTTVQSAADIEDLRRHLGVPKLNLWGISYGTHLGLAYMRAHPGAVDRVAFASVEGLDQTVKLPARLDRALERIAAASGDPELLAVMRRVHARFDAEPQTMTVTAPDGASASFRTDGFALRIIASTVPKNPDGIPMLAQLYRALDAKMYAPVAGILWSQLAEPLTLRGMPEAMDIASGISPRRLALVEAQAPSSLLGRATNAPMPQLRGAIPGLDLGDAFRRELTSSLPVLVFSGDLDLRTPLEEQAEAIAGLSNRHQVIVRGGGHDLFEAHPDMPRLLADWFSGREVTVRELTLPAAGG